MVREKKGNRKYNDNDNDDVAPLYVTLARDVKGVVSREYIIE